MNAERLRDELARTVPAPGPADWGDVRARARRARARRLGALAGVVAAAAVLGVSTPLGRALVQGFDGFSSWLSGQPGTPVSEEEQQAFEEANARSWVGFPHGTELRRLATQRAGGTTVDLVGFRSGTSTLCLRVSVTGRSRTSTMRCAPLSELRLEGAPVRPVIVDHGVGRGAKREWYGIDRVSSPNLQITAGIVADGVRAVVLEDEQGRHEVAARSNAFLYLAEQPEVAQRVRRMWARTDAGLVVIPFVPAPFGIGAGAATPREAPPAPPVEREVRGGAIGWLERREPVGEPLEILRGASHAIVRRNAVFGRVVAPDPDRPVRLAVTLSTNRRDLRPGSTPPAAPLGSDPSGICTWELTGAGAAGGCAPRDRVFRDGPITFGSLSGSGDAAFVTLHGLAVDDVARIEALLATGQRAPVPLAHNAYLVSLARTSLPARLVAYDAEGRVIGVTPPYEDFARGEVTPARGRARTLLRGASPTGATAEILVGPASDGGTCTFIRQRIDRRNGGVSISCRPLDTRRMPLELSGWGPVSPFVVGRVAPRIATVRVEFADGTSADVSPTDGHVLFVVPPSHLVEGREAVAAAGLDADGALVGRISFRPPARRP